MKRNSIFIYKPVIKVIACLLLVFYFSQGKLRAQVVIGMDTSFFSYYIPDSGYFSNTYAIQFAIKNYSSTTYTGQVGVQVAVDSAGTGTNYDTLTYDSSSVTISPGASMPDSAMMNIQANVFRPGINTVVIWPRNPAAAPNSFAVGDSLFHEIFIFDPAGIKPHETILPGIIYPNPLTEKLFVIAKGIYIERVRIMDAEGRLILSEKFDGYIDVNRLSSG